MNELDDTGRELLGRLLELTGHIGQLEIAAEEIKVKLREHCGLGTFTCDGRKALAIRPHRRFDRDLAVRVLPPELLALCTIPVVDSRTARRNLPPALVEQCMKEVGQPVVSTA